MVTHVPSIELINQSRAEIPGKAGRNKVVFEEVSVEISIGQVLLVLINPAENRLDHEGIHLVPLGVAKRSEILPIFSRIGLGKSGVGFEPMGLFKKQF